MTKLINLDFTSQYANEQTNKKLHNIKVKLNIKRSMQNVVMSTNHIVNWLIKL